MMCSLPPLLTTVLASLFISVVVNGHPKGYGGTSSFIEPGVNTKPSLGLLQIQRKFPTSLLSAKRFKRNSEHHITDCIFMGSEEGEYYHKALSNDGKTCGAYFFADPDQNIEIRFNYLNVPCENGGLVSVVDGWELNGEFFPSPHDHPKPLGARFNEFCGQKKIKQIFVSSQNAALIQYRMPARSTSFSFSVKFIRNSRPCNVLFQSTEDIYTLRNYGKRSNCSISTLFPAVVKVASLNIGVTSVVRGIELETGTIHKCQKRGLDDYVQIGGSTGLDNTKLQLADSVCGLDSKPDKHHDIIACGTTTIRLVSSGAFDNSVTVSIRQLNEEDINGYMSVICEQEGDLIE